MDDRFQHELKDILEGKHSQSVAPGTTVDCKYCNDSIWVEDSVRIIKSNAGNSKPVMAFCCSDCWLEMDHKMSKLQEKKTSEKEPDWDLL